MPPAVRSGPAPPMASRTIGDHRAGAGLLDGDRHGEHPGDQQDVLQDTVGEGVLGADMTRARIIAAASRAAMAAEPPGCEQQDDARQNDQRRATAAAPARDGLAADQVGVLTSSRLWTNSSRMDQGAFQQQHVTGAQRQNPQPSVHPAALHREHLLTRAIQDATGMDFAAQVPLSRRRYRLDHAHFSVQELRGYLPGVTNSFSIAVPVSGRRINARPARGRPGRSA